MLPFFLFILRSSFSKRQWFILSLKWLSRETKENPNSGSSVIWLNSCENGVFARSLIYLAESPCRESGLNPPGVDFIHFILLLLSGFKFVGSIKSLTIKSGWGGRGRPICTVTQWCQDASRRDRKSNFKFETDSIPTIDVSKNKFDRVEYDSDLLQNSATFRRSVPSNFLGCNHSFCESCLST